MTVALAQRIGAEVISVDSMQVYRGMNIGTAKPTTIERRGVVHHMVDIVEPDVDYSVADFRVAGRKIIEAADGPLIISGGSGLHFRALVDPMTFAPTDAELRAELEAADGDDLVRELQDADPQASLHVDLANNRRVVRAVEILRITGETPSGRAASAEAEDVRRYKPELEFTAIGLDPGSDLEQRVSTRLDEMRRGGLVQEVRGLVGRMGRTASGAVGYREILDHLGGRSSEDEAFKAIGRNTRRLAKKQRTWFQRDPRIRWIPWFEESEQRTERAMEALS